jgi:hypothetical protein
METLILPESNNSQECSRLLNELKSLRSRLIEAEQTVQNLTKDLDIAMGLYDYEVWRRFNEDKGYS